MGDRKLTAFKKLMAQHIVLRMQYDVAQAPLAFSHFFIKAKRKFARDGTALLLQKS